LAVLSGYPDLILAYSIACKMTRMEI